jgi:hypothetical protein
MTDFAPVVAFVAGLLAWLQGVEIGFLKGFVPSGWVGIASLLAGLCLVWLAFKTNLVNSLLRVAFLVLGGLLLLNFAVG